MDARGRDARGAAGAAGGDRRAERRQDDLVPDPAALRRLAVAGWSSTGIDVRDLTLAVTLARSIGMVTQETYLFHATVRENLLYAKPDATEEELGRGARGGDPRPDRRALGRLRHGRR